MNNKWSEYPIGTKAHAVNGGFWKKVNTGWMWCSSGCTFPTPGGDACRVELPSNNTISEYAAKNGLT